MSVPRYPDVKVRLVDEDGNAYFILGKVRNALRKAKVPEKEVDNFMVEATSGDYDNLLNTCMSWVDVE